MPGHRQPECQLNAFTPESYPDGRLFETITNGKGLMSGYGYNIPGQRPLGHHRLRPHAASRQSSRQITLF